METSIKTLEISKSEALNDYAQLLLDNGFIIIAPEKPSTYFHFSIGGKIGYVQDNNFGGFTYSTVHKPCRECGTGFRFNDATYDLTVETAKSCCECHSPAWARPVDALAVVKYKSVDEFVNSNTIVKTVVIRPKSTISPVMKEELTDKEISALERRILAHFDKNPRFDRHGKMVICNSVRSLNDYLGLAYTSSSSWAMLGVCNETVYLDHAKTYSYQGFGYDAGGFAVAWLSDNEDNALYIFI